MSIKTSKKVYCKYSALLLFILSGNLFAQTINIDYAGNPVSKEAQLAKGDVVMINTTVKVGTKVMIKVSPVGEVNNKDFRFTSSMENAPPDRAGAFIDQMYTGANPGWVSYTYIGMNNVTASFSLSP